MSTWPILFWGCEPNRGRPRSMPCDDDIRTNCRDALPQVLPSRFACPLALTFVAHIPSVDHQTMNIFNRVTMKGSSHPGCEIPRCQPSPIIRSRKMGAVKQEPLLTKVQIPQQLCLPHPYRTGPATDVEGPCCEVKKDGRIQT